MPKFKVGDKVTYPGSNPYSIIKIDPTGGLEGEPIYQINDSKNSIFHEYSLRLFKPKKIKINFNKKS